MSPLQGLLEITKLPVAAEVRRERWSRDLTSTALYRRNLIVLTLAASVAARQQISDLVIGTYGPYTEWREDWPAVYRALERTLSEGLEADFKIHASLGDMVTDKDNLEVTAWEKALDIGGEGLVDFLRRHTFDCNRGDGKTKAEWGTGCGACSNCTLRARAYREIRERMAEAQAAQ